ncbi:MAG: hypothetical protein VYD85_16010 [Pseudomonadota bacterium]|nr:hypothetical protein [Pseudomonadota bacterium]MED5359900.1 hypothetical protein [Pseudomonadota bacterium]
MGLKMVNAEGGKVEYLQAFIVTALFYIIASLTMVLVLLAHSSVNAAVACTI